MATLGSLSTATKFGTGAIASLNDFRLTLTSGTPVTTADVTGATTLYLSPYVGNNIALYDGSAWQILSSAEVSIALGTLVDATNYDVFAYDNAGTLTLELLAWTNDTTRATALVRQDGVWSKTGALTRRYVGTIRTTATTTTEDSVAKRFVWNASNRNLRKMRVVEGTDSWTYTTAAWRSANNSAANRLQYVQGLSEEPVSARVLACSANASGNPSRRAGVGVDVTNASSSDLMVDNNQNTGPTASTVTFYSGWPGIGFHFLQWVEYSDASGTTTWYGDAGAADVIQSGILGEVMA